MCVFLTLVGLLRSIIVRINDQSIKIGAGLLYTIKIKFKRGAKIFEEEMTSFWLKLPNAWTRHRPKISFHQMMMNYSSLERQFDSSYVS